MDELEEKLQEGLEKELEEELIAAEEEGGEEMRFEASEGGEATSQQLWMVPFADLITILMLFFLGLFGNAYAQRGAEYEKVVAQLQKMMAKEKTADLEKKIREMETIMRLEGFIEQKKLGSLIRVETDAYRVRISFQNPVLFGLGKSEIRSQADETLRAVSKVLKEIPNPVVVEGHTDNLPLAKGKYRNNFELSAARAFNVIHYFIEKEALAANRFTALGYGEFRPKSDNKTAGGRAQNRRIEITITRS